MKRILLILMLVIVGLVGYAKSDYNHPIEKEYIGAIVDIPAKVVSASFAVDLCKDKYNNYYLVLDSFLLNHDTMVKQMTITVENGESFILKRNKVLKSYTPYSSTSYSGTSTNGNINITPYQTTYYSCDKKMCFPMTPEQMKLLTTQNIIKVTINKDNLPAELHIHNIKERKDIIANKENNPITFD